MRKTINLDPPQNKWSNLLYIIGGLLLIGGIFLVLSAIIVGGLYFESKHLEVGTPDNIAVRAAKASEDYQAIAALNTNNFGSWALILLTTGIGAFVVGCISCFLADNIVNKISKNDIKDPNKGAPT